MINFCLNPFLWWETRHFFGHIKIGTGKQDVFTMSMCYMSNVVFESVESISDLKLNYT